MGRHAERWCEWWHEWHKGDVCSSCTRTFFLFFIFQPVFHVMGFSVTGRVLNGPKGEGVPEAVVTLNNQIKGGQTCWPLGLVFDHRQMERKQNLNDSVKICQLFVSRILVNMEG